MRDFVGRFLFYALLVLFPASQTNQNSPSYQNDAGQKQLIEVESRRIVAGKVLTPKGELVANAKVVIENNSGGPYRAVWTNRQGEFYIDFYFRIDTEASRYFAITLHVTKNGFQPARKMVEISSDFRPKGIAITLRPLQPENPRLLSQAELIKRLSSRLRQLGPEDGLSAKDLKDYAQGVQEFIDHNHPDQAIPLFAKVARSNAACLRCRTMLALAELAWDDWDDAKRELGESVNALIANPKLACAEPLLAYGTLVSWEQESAKASAYFAEALKYARQDALVLQEYGRSQCLQLDWQAGSESLKKALVAGAGPEARLMLAEALLWTGTVEQATAELTTYLDSLGTRKMAPRVRLLWDRLEERKKDEAAFLAAKEKARARGEEPIDYLHHPPKDLSDFVPTDDQAPLDDILAAVGQNVANLFADLFNISAVELVRLEKVSRKGKVNASLKFKYLYLCLAAAEKWGSPLVEYRSDEQGHEMPRLGLKEGYMLTGGFISSPLVFHPAHRNGSSFRLLGYQKMKGRNTILVGYAQLPARSQILGRFQDGQRVVTTFNQGLAWIDAGNYQIVRLVSDLLRPLSQVRLEKQTIEIDFDEVRFARGTEKFWLPVQVIVTIQLNGRVLRNTHAYSDFRLFNVEASQKIATPKQAGQTVDSITNEPSHQEKPVTAPPPPPGAPPK